MGYKKSVRIAPPAHFKLNIGCFSLFLDKEFDRYESDMFEVGGYKWILYLYPSGYSQQGGKNYLSLYLAIAETQTLPPGWDVRVNSKLFVFNHIDGDFLTIQDEEAWRFHEHKREWGIPRLISQTDLHDASRGFLYKDSFICGVEIYPVKHNGKGETLSQINKPKGGTYTWKISNFSEKVELCMCSPEFTVGGYKWNIEINPNGKQAEHLSFYLNLIDAKTSLPPGVKVYLKFKSRMKSQLVGKLNHINTGTHWFSSSSASWGFAKYIKSSVLNDLSEGYLKDDSIVPELEIIAMSHLTLLP